MGKKDFDNLLKVIQTGQLLVTSTIVSTELDFELPRGFIAKIWKVIFEWIGLDADLEGGGALELTMGINQCLLRDPDDITTVAIPENNVQHDVVLEAAPWVHQNPTSSTSELPELRKTLVIPEHIDLITARNMRFNTVGVGDDVASLTESISRCEVYYTLEKVTDADILDLLDIL